MKNKLILSGSLFVLLTLLLALMLFIRIFDENEAFSLGLASFIGLCNFILFVVFVQISLKKSNKTFLILNFGGMIFRLFLMLIVIFIALIYLKVDRYAFIFGLLFWYMFFQLFEILIVKESYKKS